MGNHIYKDEIPFSSILELSRIDDYICDRLFPLIRNFEKKFRNAIVQEICLNFHESAYADQYGIAYIEDINRIMAGADPELSVVGPNLNMVLTRTNYAPDERKRIENKRRLLEKLVHIGREELPERYKTNRPIKQAIKSQKIAPFWLIASSLDFGDLQLLFSMQNKETQHRIINFVMEEEPTDKPNIRKIFKFSGKIEKIRKMRNTVNHYVPIFPLLLEQVPKNISEDPDILAIELLKGLRNHWIGQGASCSVDLSPLMTMNKDSETLYEIPITGFNKRKLLKIQKVVEILNK